MKTLLKTSMMMFFSRRTFESPKYFDIHEKDIRKEFRFKDSQNLKKYIFKEIDTLMQLICIRQNRFNEGKGRNKPDNIKILKIILMNKLSILINQPI